MNGEVYALIRRLLNVVYILQPISPASTPVSHHNSTSQDVATITMRGGGEADSSTTNRRLQHWGSSASLGSQGRGQFNIALYIITSLGE